MVKFERHPEKIPQARRLVTREPNHAGEELTCLTAAAMDPTSNLPPGSAPWPAGMLCVIRCTHVDHHRRYADDMNTRDVAVCMIPYGER
jgi:hypothetical protein